MKGVSEMSANLMESLRITLFGMLGIFAVMIVIYLVIAILNKITKQNRQSYRGIYSIEEMPMLFRIFMRFPARFPSSL